MKMINFKEFIDKDITAKKTLITTLPTKTKTNKKKYNASIDNMIEKYEEYRTSVKNYLLAKSKSFTVTEDENNLGKLNEQVASLENVRFLLNPTNTYIEKMGFDHLLYQLNNSYMFNFKSLNEIINLFLDKFELIGIKLQSDDFNYTCYVHEYMSSFLQVRYSSDKKYNKVSEIFESIYWINPELIEHIELNFRKLLRENSKKFNAYITKLQKDAMMGSNIKNYQDCMEKLKSVSIDRNFADSESIPDIINAARNKGFDIKQYLADSKVRKTAYESLISSNIDYTDEDKMKKVCSTLDKLRCNVIEFDNYNTYLPIFTNFKEDYEELLKTSSKDYKGLKNVEAQIISKEKELDKLNRKIFGGKSGLFDFSSSVPTGTSLKRLQIESVNKAKELYELYKQYDEEYFKFHVLDVLSNSMTIYDVLNLYYSFACFRNMAVQKAYKLTEYDEIIKTSDEFYRFAMDPTNVIIAGVPVFEEANVAKVIANKYRLNSINIDEDDLKPENLKALLNKILLILRVQKIEHSDATSLDKIWFMVEVDKIIASEENR